MAVANVPTHEARLALRRLAPIAGALVAAGRCAALAQPCAPAWSGWLDAEGPNGFVRALVGHDGFLFARTEGNAVAGVPANNIAMFDGTIWTGSVAATWPYDSGNAGMGGLASFVSRLYAPRGPAPTVAGFEIGAVWNGNGTALGSWSGWPSAGLFMDNGPLHRADLAVVHDNVLYVSGNFALPPVGDGWPFAQRRFATFDGSAWSLMPGGYGPTLPNANDDGLVSIQSMASYNGSLYVSGNFTRLRSGEHLPRSGTLTAAGFIARWDGSSWQALPNGGLNSYANAMTVYNGELVCGGDFSSTGDGAITLSRLARFDGATWRPLAGGLTGVQVRSLAVADDNLGPALFVGGTFGTANNAPPPTADTVTFRRVVRWNGARFSTLASGINGATALYAMARYDPGTGEGLFVGGDALIDPTRPAAGSGRVARWGPGPRLDTDGDGIYDVWEEQGIDADCNGSIDLALNTMGANPLRKDVFIELDAMPGREPVGTSLLRVAVAFASAPVSNPDGSTGVSLHILSDETTLPLVDFPSALADVHILKATRFGTPAERASANAKAILDAKRRVFRYCIFGNTHSSGPSSGVAELPGDDFTVTLGPAAGLPDLELYQAATLMHELGHTLGLYHGGTQIDWTNDLRHNFKPNYRSIMNYAWQFGFDRPGFAIDYSRESLPPLNEAALIEGVGIAAPYGAVAMAGPAPVLFVPMSGPIDWNRNGFIDPLPVAADVNTVESGAPATPGDTLSGAEDWSRLKYNFRNSPNYAAGVSPVTTARIDRDMTLALRELTNGPGCPCSADFDGSGGTPDLTDISAFFDAWLAGDPAADSDCSGGTPDLTDITVFFNAWLAGGC